MVERAGIRVERCDGGDVVPLAVGLRPRGPGPLHRFGALLQVGGGRRAHGVGRRPDRVIEAHRRPPVGHGARRVRGGRVGEALLGVLVLE